MLSIGLRPEHISIDTGGPLAAEVEMVEPLGLSTQFYAKLAGQQICVFAMGRPTVKPGEIVRLSAPPEALHVFDPRTGGRIDG